MTVSNPNHRAAATAAVPVSSTRARPATDRTLATTLCAAVLALGLAGCGGGSGGGTMPETVTPAAVIAAIRDANAAADAVVANLSPALLRAAEDAIVAAKAAVEDAGGLSADERREHHETIAGIEEKLETARESIEMARGDEVAKLTAALEGDPIADIAATVEHGAAPTLRGTVPGTPATTVTSLETTLVTGSAMTEGTWTRGTYTAAGAAGTDDEVVFYTDIDAPGAQPFSGEMGKYGTADGIDTDGNLVIGVNADATLIVSPHFPTGPGIVTHTEDSQGVVEVAGTFDGAPGTYRCTAAMGDSCTSSVRHGGGITLAGGGGWKFVPDADATVEKPDPEYRYFGSWLRKAGESYAIGVFHGSVADGPPDFTMLPTLQGTATYTGPTVGNFFINPQLGAAQAGDFTADATLEVDFGDDSTLGTVTGIVDRFMVDGTLQPWSVELQSAAITSDGAIAAGGTDAARTQWSIRGQAGQPTGAPTWEGQFHDIDENQLPNVATGKFEAAYGALGRMSGAFGATAE